MPQTIKKSKMYRRKTLNKRKKFTKRKKLSKRKSFTKKLIKKRVNKRKYYHKRKTQRLIKYKRGGNIFSTFFGNVKQRAVDEGKKIRTGIGEKVKKFREKGDENGTTDPPAADDPAAVKPAASDAAPQPPPDANLSDVTGSGSRDDPVKVIKVNKDGTVIIENNDQNK